MVLHFILVGCPRWYSCVKADREYLDKQHRRAAIIIEGYTVSQSQKSHTFGWSTLQSRRDYLKCLLVFKSLRGLAPAYLLIEFSHSRDFQSYNTRYKDLLRLPLAHPRRPRESPLNGLKNKAVLYFSFAPYFPACLFE